MNAQELQEVLSQKLNLSPQETNKLLLTFAEEVVQGVSTEQSVSFSDLGQWVLTSQAPHIFKDTTTEKCYLLPPQYVLSFEVSPSYKLWIQNLTR